MTADDPAGVTSARQGHRATAGGVLVAGYRPWHWVPASLPGRRRSRFTAQPVVPAGCRNPVPRMVPRSPVLQASAKRCRRSPAPSAAADLAARRSGKDAGTQCHGRYLAASLVSQASAKRCRRSPAPPAAADRAPRRSGKDAETQCQARPSRNRRRCAGRKIPSLAQWSGGLQAGMTQRRQTARSVIPAACRTPKPRPRPLSQPPLQSPANRQ